ncbi:MAG: hypothetical protein CMC75_11660 [Flavobacteriaceae bacterium]|nr:hypothetical protein [Flavobacteriaceae bacterium]
MKVALVLTVKNEERLLRNNMLYHRAIGAEHIFVYFDGTTDNGKQRITDLDFVTSQNSVAAEKYQHLDYLTKFTSQAAEHHTARQCLNTFDAQQQCKSLGYDWLISMDADELVCTDISVVSKLPDFFNKIPSDVDVVYFQTREAVQRKVWYTNVFADETLFKTVPTYRSRFKNIQKVFYNPFSEETVKFSYWYGQTMGKGAIRIGKEVIPHNVHRYKTIAGQKPKSIKAGYVLHYHAYDATDFIKKFTNFAAHPDTFLSGNRVESIKLLLRDIVNKSDRSPKQLEAYFKDNLMFSAAEIDALKQNRYLLFFRRNPPPLTEITSVQKVFQFEIAEV